MSCILPFQFKISQMDDRTISSDTLNTDEPNNDQSITTDDQAIITSDQTITTSITNQPLPSTINVTKLNCHFVHMSDVNDTVMSVENSATVKCQ